MSDGLPPEEQPALPRGWRMEHMWGRAIRRASGAGFVAYRNGLLQRVSLFDDDTMSIEGYPLVVDVLAIIAHHQWRPTGETT